MTKSRSLAWKELSIEFVVGTFFFAALIILGFFTIILSRDKLFGDTYEVKVRFPSVSALSEGDGVHVRGVEIGRVTGMKLQNSDVLVTLLLDQEVTVREGYKIEVQFSSVLGGRHVMIDLGPATGEKIPENTILYGEPSVDLMNEAAKMIQDIRKEVENLRGQMEDAELVPKAAALMDDLRELASGIREGEGTIGLLFKKPDLYNKAQEMVDTVQGAYASVQKTSDDIQEIADGLKEGKGTIGKLLADDALYADASAVVKRLSAGEGTLGKLLVDDEVYENVRAVTANLRDGQGTIGRLLADESLYEEMKAAVENVRTMTAKLSAGESSLGKLLNDQGEIYQTLADSMTELQVIVKDIQEGKGTIGKLLQDSTLYDNTLDAINQAKQAIEDFREQAPISTFGSLIFGAF